MFLNAQTTASTLKRQQSVLTSKYPRYSLSGGTINDVITAAATATARTTFFFRKAANLFPEISLLESPVPCISAFSRENAINFILPYDLIP